MAKRKGFLEGWRKSLGNRPAWFVFLTNGELRFGVRCLGCFQLLRCQQSATVTCKCGLSFTAPSNYADVKRTQQSKKFFEGIGLDKLVFHRDEINNEHSYGTTRTLDYVEKDFGS
jgi:hypothetical protein